MVEYKYKYKCKDCAYWGSHTFTDRNGDSVEKIGCKIIDEGNLQAGKRLFYPIRYMEKLNIMVCDKYTTITHIGGNENGKENL